MSSLAVLQQWEREGLKGGRVSSLAVLQQWEREGLKGGRVKGGGK